jgi:sugar phosphate isomerase/epimerase
MIDRRQFLAGTTASVAASGLALDAPRPAADTVRAQGGTPPRGRLFELSLAQWSLHRSLGIRGEATMRDVDFAKVAHETGFTGIEYVNQFFKDKARDSRHLAALRRAARDHGVQSLLIMCDGEGALGAPDDKARARAVENHFRWVEAARLLGCHSIRVNAQSRGSREEQMKLAADGLRQLTEFADLFEVNVIVENHGGLSSDGAWLAAVMRKVDHARCGTLPDFGNFKLGGGKQYDRYKGVRELMPFAKAVSAKSHDFDDKGDEVNTDYLRMMKIVVESGYRGYVGVEYEGAEMPEMQGVPKTIELLRRVRDQLS